MNTVSAGPAGAAQRTMTASQVAAATGRRKRIVIRWASEGLACDRRIVNGRETCYFAREEVDEYLRSRGLDLVKQIDPPAAAAAGPVEVREAPGLFGDLYQLVLERVCKPTDWDAAVKQMRAAVARAHEHPPAKDAGEAERQRYSATLANLSGELRQLERAAIEHRRAVGELLDRRAATAAITTLASTVRSEVRQAAHGIAEDIMVSALPLLGADRAHGAEEVLRRAVAAAVGDACDRMLTRIADAVAAAGGAMDRLASREDAA